MLLFYVCVCVCVHAHCVWAHLYVCVHVHAHVLWRTCKVRGQLCGVDSLLSPLPEFWGWYLGLLVCKQMLLPAELPHWLLSNHFYMLIGIHVFVVSCDHHYHPLLRLFYFPELHLAQLSISPSQSLTPAILLSVDLATQEPHMSASAVFSFCDCVILPSTMSSNLSILLHVSELLPY